MIVAVENGLKVRRSTRVSKTTNHQQECSLIFVMSNQQLFNLVSRETAFYAYLFGNSSTCVIDALSLGLATPHLIRSIRFELLTICGVSLEMVAK